MIYRYTPVITPGPNGTDYRPWTTSNDLMELCTLDNYRYVNVPDNVEVTIPPEITTWELVNITNELREQIKLNSPLCELARTRFIENIRKAHSLDDELYYARIATGSMMGFYQLLPGESELLTKYQVDVEAARTILHETYAAVGL